DRQSVERRINIAARTCVRHSASQTGPIRIFDRLLWRRRRRNWCRCLRVLRRRGRFRGIRRRRSLGTVCRTRRIGRRRSSRRRWKTRGLLLVFILVARVVFRATVRVGLFGAAVKYGWSVLVVVRDHGRRVL